MNCPRVRSLISAYVDGELPGVEMLAIRRHIGECGECRAEFDSILLVKRSFAALAPKHPSGDLAAKISSQLDRASCDPKSGVLLVLRKHLRGFSGGLRLVTVAAGLIIAITLIGRSGNGPTALVYSPKSPNIVIRNFEEPDPARLFSISSVSSPSSTRVLRPAFDGWGFRSGPAASIRMPSNGYRWLTGY